MISAKDSTGINNDIYIPEHMEEVKIRLMEMEE